MGSGAWSKSSFESYSSSRGRSVDKSSGYIVGDYSNQDMFKCHSLVEELKPFKVMRECCDSDEHPQTIPVILALDVTGSMGQAAVEVAKKLNAIITKLYDKVNDVEFMIMGIGDLAYDSAPIQISQFESDIRIAECLDKIYFEFGGGGNSYESYTAAWYMGLNHCKLDCWKRGKKGKIITMGDEYLNPYLPYRALSNFTGDTLQADVETTSLYEEAAAKFDIYHIDVAHYSSERSSKNVESFKSILPLQNVCSVSIDAIADVIEDIVSDTVTSFIPLTESGVNITEEGISW